jgi:hypothetical protein
MILFNIVNLLWLDQNCVCINRFKATAELKAFRHKPLDVPKHISQLALWPSATRPMTGRLACFESRSAGLNNNSCANGKPAFAPLFSAAFGPTHPLPGNSGEIAPKPASQSVLWEWKS